MRGLFLITFILVSILLVGCGSDQYAIERQYWQAQRQTEKIFKNPHASPPKELERVVGLLNNFIQKYPQNNLSIEAEFQIARLYMVKEEYDKSRTQLKTIIDKYSKFDNICAEATFLIGNSYQIQDKWSLALEQYKRIMQSYPVTPRGLDIPIYIAQYYKIKYQPDKMISAYQEAINHYKIMADTYINSPLGLKTQTLVANCYIVLKDWQNAIDSFNVAIDRYQGKVNLDGILMEQALIYANQLKDKIKAKGVLEKLIHDYPRSRFKKTATLLLKEGDKNE